MTGSATATALSPDDPHLRAVRAFYGERRAERSGVRLIEHIHDGLAIMAAIDARTVAQRAFCLHPLVQMDDDLARTFADDKQKTALAGCELLPLALAMEYRRCANAHLSKHAPETLTQISFAPFVAELRDMLIADKVQNRRDFERHHAKTHERAAELAEYFARWLAFLGVDEERYQKLIGHIGGR